MLLFETKWLNSITLIRNKVRVLLIILSFLMYSSIGYSQDPSKKGSDFPEYKWLNKRLPLDTLISYQGDTLVLFTSDKHYVISFWFTNCPPCISEIRWLNKLKREFSNQNIEFLAISFDSIEDIENLLLTHPFDFDLYQLNQNIINENSLTIGYPTNLIVKSNGEVIFQKSGGSSDQEQSKEVYDLLSEELKVLMK